MIVLFTDFGVQGPYVGQLRLVLAQQAVGVRVVELMHDAPNFNIQASAYLLAALVDQLPVDCLVVAVVDPGVGSSDREPVILQADGRRFVGPGNGLFDVIARRAQQAQWSRIDWRPAQLSHSFHGRDLFAPVAAMLAKGLAVTVSDYQPPILNWPDDLAQIIYHDNYGNAMTGLRAADIDKKTVFEINGHYLSYARTFVERPVGEAFWYENSIGLVEFAVNQGSAVQKMSLRLGDAVYRRSA